MNKLAAGVVAALLALPGLAQEGDTVESLSEIRDFERADLDGQSIRSQGDLTRFDVRVRWRNTDQRPPGAPAGRYIRYVANCASMTLGVAAVATVDENGKMLKSYVVPPGATDTITAAPESREARWLQQACQ